MLKKYWIVAGMCVAMALFSLSVFARDRDDHDRDSDRGSRQHSERFHYRDGHWYHRGLFGFEFLAPALTIGAVVDALPYGYTTVVVRGEPYYRHGGYYYRRYSQGYVVVPEPMPLVVVREQKSVGVGVTVPQQDAGEAVVINVPNKHGGYTPVKLIKHKGGYVGPQGEYYEKPTIDQLKVLYGK